MQADELYKFSDGMLMKVRDEFHHRVLDFDLGYNKEMESRKWMSIEKKRPELMVELIDKQMREGRIIRNLERLVGARELEMDYKLMTHTTKTELTLEQTQQGVSDEVLVSIKGVEELKRKVKINGEKKEAILTLRVILTWVISACPNADRDGRILDAVTQDRSCLLWCLDSAVGAYVQFWVGLPERVPPLFGLRFFPSSFTLGWNHAGGPELLGRSHNEEAFQFLLTCVTVALAVTSGPSCKETPIVKSAREMLLRQRFGFKRIGLYGTRALVCDSCGALVRTWKIAIDVIETINIELEHKVAKLLKENETLKRHYKEMFDSIKTTRAKNIEHTTSLIANNDKFKAQLQEKGFAIAALKNELRKLTGNSVNTKFAKSSILGKPALQPRRNQSVVRQPTAFKSERPRISKQRFASQVDVNNDLSKPVTTHYLPKERESVVAKPHHMIAPGSSRYSSNDMVHNHYLEEAKKKTQESSRNSEPSVMPSARSQSTTNGSKPKLRINNQKSRNWPASKSSCVTIKTVPIAEHSRNSRSFSDSKHFVCSTCQKCVFNANHDSCVTKFLNEVNSRAKVPSNKTTKRYIPVEQTSFAKKPERQIPKRQRSSIKKTSVVHEKTMTPISCLRWKPTGKIFKTVGLRWVPTGKILTSSTTKVDSAEYAGEPQVKYYNLIERHSAKILLTEAKYANQAKHEGLNFKRNMQD
ncbi:hypothetical protein Tco_1213632 [Tanacetum coccineum]